MSTPKLGFEPERFSLKLDQILPLRVIKEPQKSIKRYRTILASMKAFGIIEPLVVHRQKSGHYLLLDGHLRLEGAKELGLTSVDCIASTDDESFTYNARINRISPVQEHHMIMQAIRNGVSPEKIAKGLNRSVEAVQANTQLLVGIDPETVELIKDKRISIGAIKILKRVTPVRQVEMAELMGTMNNFSASYARALLMNTPTEFLTERERRRQISVPKAEEMEQIEREIRSMMTDFKAAEESHGERVLHFSFIRAYVKKLLDNARIVRHLTANHNDILAQFEEIVATDSLVAV
jgi:ParB-like chromosome segregation protein Spo0J